MWYFFCTFLYLAKRWKKSAAYRWLTKRKTKIKPGDDGEELRDLLLDDELPVRLRLMLQDLGTTFIKLGQLLSTRPDIVGEKIAGELENLQENTSEEVVNKK